MIFFFFKQKTAYEMRISDWSSDVCSSDLTDYVTRLYDAETLWNYEVGGKFTALDRRLRLNPGVFYMDYSDRQEYVLQPGTGAQTFFNIPRSRLWGAELDGSFRLAPGVDTTFGLGYINSKVKRTDATIRSEEHTSELQSLMRISYAVFCLKKKKKTKE